MSSSYSVTVPMTTHITVPKPLDNEGRPLPVTYEVKAVVGGAADPEERKARLREEFQKRLAAFESWLISRGNRNVGLILWATRGFIAFILDPEKYGVGVTATASPSAASDASAAQSRTTSSAPLPTPAPPAAPALPATPAPPTAPDSGPTRTCAPAPSPTSSGHKRRRERTHHREDRHRC